MGNQYGTAIEQAKQSENDVSRGIGTSCRTVPAIWDQQNDADNEIESRNDSRRGSGEREKVTLRQERQGFEKSHVYDLVDCGPRHRFVIRNDNGEVFISHNSMGHGIDSLQKVGSIVVWFGMNWSLDLYDQMNARLRRQGQGKPVVCHRILCHNTLDQAQVIALEDKATTQSGLRAAIKRYQQSR